MKELIEIQKELKAPKGQYNSFGKYKYRSAEDILEAVKPLLHKNGCQLTLSDEIVLIGDRFYVKAVATLKSATDCEEVAAYAREDLDKKGMDGSQITGTASSYARKYALNGLFCIDDTKDADTDEYANQQKGKTESKPERKASPVQLKRLKEFYGDKFSEYLAKNNLKSEDEITMTLADTTITKITDYERRKNNAND